jgi:predicted transcriptional regulator
LSEGDALSRRNSKRSKTDLYAEVLEVITRYPEGVRITRMSYGVGVPVDRLKALVETLCSNGLVRKSADDAEVVYGATSRGLDFLETYWKMMGFFEILGEKR